MAIPRTVHDIRTARSIPARVSSASEQEAYARLSLLATEKHRLMDERKIWERKLERIEKRVREIDQQMDQLGHQVSEINKQGVASSSRALWHEVELSY